MSRFIPDHESGPSSELPVSHRFGFAFIKPGYEAISPRFQADLEENGIYTVHQTPFRLHRGAIDYIYRDSTHEPFYPNMRRYLADHAILGMVLEGEEDVPTQDVLNSLKRGSDGYPSLRDRYHKPEDVVDDDDFNRWCKGEHDPERHDELTIKLTQGNVFHAADDPIDAMHTFRALKKYNPDFYDPNETTRTRRLRRLIEYIEEIGYDKE